MYIIRWDCSLMRVTWRNDIFRINFFVYPSLYVFFNFSFGSLYIRMVNVYVFITVVWANFNCHDESIYIFSLFFFSIIFPLPKKPLSLSISIFICVLELLSNFNNGDYYTDWMRWIIFERNRRYTCIIRFVKRKRDNFSYEKEGRNPILYEL